MLSSNTMKYNNYSSTSWQFYHNYKIWYSCRPKTRWTIFFNINSAWDKKVEGFLDANSPTQFILEPELARFFFKNWRTDWKSEFFLYLCPLVN